MDSLLPRDLKEHLIRHPMNHASKVLEATLILFSDEVFLFH
jgi:hypothetical protein